MGPSDGYLTEGQTGLVTVLKVNKEIWRRVQGSAIKNHDLQLMNIQGAITKCTYDLCKIAEGLLKSDKPVDRKMLLPSVLQKLLPDFNSSCNFTTLANTELFSNRNGKTDSPSSVYSEKGNCCYSCQTNH